jgi:DNA-binding LacI/PurR family transcriptional regulator
MHDVAARVGLSQSAVSLVFRGAPGVGAETRDRVLRAAEEIGYHRDNAASLLRRGRSRQLGVLFRMRHPFAVELTEHIYSAAETLEYHVVLSALTDTRTERKAIDELLGNHCEGVILLGIGSDNDVLRDVARRVPVVAIGLPSSTPGVDVVRSDDSRGLGEAVAHLVELGHQRIAYIDGGAGPGAPQRRRGYRNAMRKHDLADFAQVFPGEYTEIAGARAAEKILASESLPTAVIAANDECALGVLDSMLRAGVNVPDDISVVGYDDSRIARLPFINLTTVRQDAATMADAAVKAAAERLDGGRQDPRNVVLPAKLVVRSTTGHAP